MDEFESYCITDVNLTYQIHKWFALITLSSNAASDDEDKVLEASLHLIYNDIGVVWL